MKIIDAAISGITKQDRDKLISCLEKMSKEQIQTLAQQFQATSATIYMSGTWVESGKGDLVDSDGNILQADVSVDRGYKGWLKLYYGPNSLHLASIVAIDRNNYDYDEDYFTLGEMRFSEDYGLSPDSFELDCDCKSEDRHINEHEIENYEDYDLFDLSIEDYSEGGRLVATSISANRIEIKLESDRLINLPLQDISPNVNWFVFAVLFISSKKLISDIESHHDDIQEFIDERLN
jgi:hypothetical protein